MKVGDLVKVGPPSRPFITHPFFVSIVLEVNKSENHPNGLGLVKVLEAGQEAWYPIGCIELINESR
ncbi:MAG TPA: hypothetical protein EYN67_03565 [Flavobacteriales bacterium]|nr:hypothetical protein [Flavobacteriales bacterium]